MTSPVNEIITVELHKLQQMASMISFSTHIFFLNWPAFGFKKMTLIFSHYIFKMKNLSQISKKSICWQHLCVIKMKNILVLAFRVKTASKSEVSISQASTGLLLDVTPSMSQFPSKDTLIPPEWLWEAEAVLGLSGFGAGASSEAMMGRARLSSA